MNKIAIIGGGASGLACACELVKDHINAEITVFEQNQSVGKKILATGNGRCNITNLNATAADYYDSADFVSSVLDQFSPYSHILFFDSLGLQLYSDNSERVYPKTNQAATVLDILKVNCISNNVLFKTDCQIQSIEYHNEKFIINGKNFDFLVLACGGKASVKQYNGERLTKSLGHSFTKYFPALVRLTTDSPVSTRLKGVRSDVALTLLSSEDAIAEEKGELLFGDRVISGICAMQLSYYVQKLIACGAKDIVLSVDFADYYDYDELSDIICKNIAHFGKLNCRYLICGLISSQICTEIFEYCHIDSNKNCDELSEIELDKLVYAIKNFRLDITGTKGYPDAQVMMGGVKLDEVDSKTLESKFKDNLYFCGEVLDVCGPCGGYNLNWAWSSGRAVASSIAKRIKDNDSNQ